MLRWWWMKYLAEELNQRAPEVICLQEIQANTYIPLLRRRLPDYPHFAMEWKFGAPKGGLLTVSHLPIVNKEFFPYSNRGRFWSVGFADWTLLKGVLSTQYEIDGQRIIVMNTHLHANYMGKWEPNNSMARIQSDQVNHLTDLARSQPEDALVIICGDFNFPRNTFLYDDLIRKSGFIDPLVEDPRPTYRPVSLLASRWSIALDFVLYRPPLEREVSVSADILPIENPAARMAHQRFLTDHCALTLNISWRNSI